MALEISNLLGKKPLTISELLKSKKKKQKPTEIEEGMTPQEAAEVMAAKLVKALMEEWQIEKLFGITPQGENTETPITEK